MIEWIVSALGVVIIMLVGIWIDRWIDSKRPIYRIHAERVDEMLAQEGQDNE